MENIMKRLIELLESKRPNSSRGMQKVLREIDSRPLARILNQIDPKYHRIFFDNMTDKAVSFIKADMGIEEEFLKSAYNDKGADLSKDVEMLCGLIETYTVENFDERQEYSNYPNEIKLGNPKETTETFFELSVFARKNGLLALNGIEEGTSNKLFKKAMEIVLAGTDPFIVDELLENYKNQFLRNAEEVYTMIKIGMRSIQDGDHPRITQEKMKSINDGE
jgi:flagellar FliG-like protein